MIVRTDMYCKTAVWDITAKSEALNTIFDGSDDLSLLHVEELCMGFRQFHQREVLSNFAQEFFDRIEDCVNKRAWMVTRHIYKYLAPNMFASSEEIAKFTVLKEKLEGYTEE